MQHNTWILKGYVRVVAYNKQSILCESGIYYKNYENKTS